MSADKRNPSGPFTTPEPRAQEIAEFHVVRNVVRRILKSKCCEIVGREGREER